MFQAMEVIGEKRDLNRIWYTLTEMVLHIKIMKIFRISLKTEQDSDLNMTKKTSYII